MHFNGELLPDRSYGLPVWLMVSLRPVPLRLLTSPWAQESSERVSTLPQGSLQAQEKGSGTGVVIFRQAQAC